jgi:lincosamide and streptogramin A transport system ATP-binding/permease protein
MMKRSKGIEARQQAAIDQKSKLLKNIESPEKLKISQMVCQARRLAELKNVGLFYGETTVCTGVSFTIEHGDRIALCGKNGSGKSSLMKLIWGENITYTGIFQKASGLKISFVSQDTSQLQGDLSDYAAGHNLDESLFKTILRKLDFSRKQFEKEMEDFSDGQRKKVILARSLCEKVHVHIWDEPLNYIDVISRLQIEELLLEYAPTIVFVEHDSEFCRNVATKVIEL